MQTPNNFNNPKIKIVFVEELFEFRKEPGEYIPCDTLLKYLILEEVIKQIAHIDHPPVKVFVFGELRELIDEQVKILQQ